ncbi:MAG: hypothetical protein LBI53_06945 [Candidatus Peribacteria bacterium]|jgi:hypothetical protein|nr:hypothetical protein [Candidatus Peribacteria bacterium]
MAKGWKLTKEKWNLFKRQKEMEVLAERVYVALASIPVHQRGNKEKRNGAYITIQVEESENVIELQLRYPPQLKQIRAYEKAKRCKDFMLWSSQVGEEKKSLSRGAIVFNENHETEDLWLITSTDGLDPNEDVVMSVILTAKLYNLTPVELANFYRERKQEEGVENEIIPKELFQEGHYLRELLLKFAT